MPDPEIATTYDEKKIAPLLQTLQEHGQLVENIVDSACVLGEAG